MRRLSVHIWDPYFIILYGGTMRRVIFMQLMIARSNSILICWPIEEFVKSVIRQIIQVLLVAREELIPLLINVLSPGCCHFAPFWCLRVNRYIQINWYLVYLDLPLFKFTLALNGVIAISLLACSLHSNLEIFCCILEPRVSTSFLYGRKLWPNNILRSLIELFWQIYFLWHWSIIFKLVRSNRLEWVCMSGYWVAMLPNNRHRCRILMHGMPIWQVVLVQSLLRYGFLNRIFLLFPH